MPVLKNFPTRYIHEPWTAPEAVQKSAKCIIGDFHLNIQYTRMKYTLYFLILFCCFVNLVFHKKK